ncbi:hypothetical protein [Streptacidiphilus rugosus]|uniref:hypothetical protein n=1 Tax=Streptacidiphilus rugosus TaxID=405783 RepID=UPI000565A00F|nr:hypothetical protein [Streptacidiphilus rugosus]
MPIALILVSVLLQATADGYLSGRLGVDSSLGFSCLAFVTATLACTALYAIRRARSRTRDGGRPAPEPEPERRRLLLGLMVRMNLATAVTFLGFYLSLAWVPAALASSVQSGVGPLAVICIGLAAKEKAPARSRTAYAAVLLALSLAVAVLLDGRVASLSPAALAGTVLVAVSGASAALLARLSRRLGRAGADPTWVMAHRFHLTYLCAGGVLLVRGTGGKLVAGHIPLPVMAVVALAAVALPLLLLQIGLQRADPLAAMVLLSMLPGLVYLTQAVLGGGFRPAPAVLIGALVLVAALAARPPRPAGPPEAASGAQSPEAARVSVADSACAVS